VNLEPGTSASSTERDLQGESLWDADWREALDLNAAELAREHLAAAGVQHWLVSVAYPDGRSTEYPITAAALAEQAAELARLVCERGADVSIQPDGDLHPLVVLDGLDREQASRARTEALVVLRTGAGRAQAWFRAPRPLGPKKRRQLQHDYVVRYGGHAGKWRLSGVGAELISCPVRVPRERKLPARPAEVPPSTEQRSEHASQPGSQPRDSGVEIELDG
jgi:hypothetical protein